MTNRLIITFVKNAISGKTKTRLAATIGNDKALQIYYHLLTLTENAVSRTEAAKEVHFSNKVEESNWEGFSKYVQSGADLGERMQNAFEDGFKRGFNQIVLLGSDLPDLSDKVINSAFSALNKTEVVLGPALDGGYYLIGLSKANSCIFENMPWSEEGLFKKTIEVMESKKISYKLLNPLNDIDTLDDLKSSSIYPQIEHLLYPK